MASVNQMLNRMTSGHHRVLVAIRDGQKLERCSYGDLNAMRTLGHWGAVAGGTITEIGQALLARWDQPRKPKTSK